MVQSKTNNIGLPDPSVLILGPYLTSNWEGCYPLYLELRLSFLVTTSRGAVKNFFVQNGATMAKISKQEIYLIHEVL